MKNWLALWLFVGFISLAHGHQPTDTAMLQAKPFSGWKTLDTPHFHIHFASENQAFAQQVAAIAETVYQRLTEKLQWQPKGAIPVVVADSFDGSNGGASILPYNRFFILMNTPVEGSLLDNSPWIEQVFTHELVHILHLDQAAGPAAKVRNLFGRLLFGFPQIFNPLWVIEGIAVYEETDAQRGVGRGQHPLYEAAIRAEVANGLRSQTELSFHGSIGTDWPSNQSYLYGYYFFEFLAAEFGEDKAYEYLLNWNSNVIPWQMDRRARVVFNTSSQQLWQQYQHYLIANYGSLPQAAAISQPLVTAARLNSNPVWLADGSFYFYQADGYQRPSIQRITAAGEQQQVAEVRAYSQFDVHPDGGVVLARAAVCDNVNLFTDLFILDPQGDWQRLTHCQRYPRVAWSSAGTALAAVHVQSGLSQIDILDTQGQLKQRLPALPAGEAIGHIAWSPDDSKLVAAVRRQATGWTIEELNLASGQWRVLVQDGQLNHRPRYSATGNEVFYLSASDNVFNVHQLDLASGNAVRVSRTTSAVLDYGVSEDQLRVVEYTADGLVINQQPLAPWGDSRKVVVSAEKPLATLENQADYLPEQYTEIQPYRPWNTLAPRAWFAMLYADSEDNGWLQFYLQGQDVLGYHAWQLAPAYYYDKERWGGNLSYLAYHRLALLLDRTYQTVDLAGTGSAWDEETRYQVLWKQPFNGLDGTFEISLGVAFEELERHSENDGILAAQDDNLAGLSLAWRDYDRYLHSVSPEQGRAIEFRIEQYDTFSDGTYQGAVASLDWREYISLAGSQVLALRGVIGQGDALAKPFELGTDADSAQALGGAIGFGRTDYGLRGYGSNLDQLSGQNLRLWSAEYRLSLGEWYNGWMKPPLGLGKLGLSVFLDTGAAWDDGESKEYLTGVGFELHPQVLLGFNLPLAVTLGVAHGLDDELGKTSVYGQISAVLP